MSNSQVFAPGEAECNFELRYEYNYSLIALKYMRLPTNHIAIPMTLYPLVLSEHKDLRLQGMYVVY